MLCDYQNALGAPRTWLHAILMVGDTAAVDYFGTIGLSVGLTWLTGVPLEVATIGMFVLSIALHALFCVPTNTTRWLRSFGG